MPHLDKKPQKALCMLKAAPIKPCCQAMAKIYEPVRVLGRGGHGVVFLCKNKASGALVACKISLSHFKHPPCDIKVDQAQLHKSSCIKSKHKSSLKSKLATLLSSRKKNPKAQEEITDAVRQERLALQCEEELKFEIEMMQMLQQAGKHPNILPLLSTFESEDGFAHLITPFCEGGSLSDKLIHEHKMPASTENQKPLLADDRRAAKILVSLASALSYLHVLDIVHRDVKLDNIFMQRKKAGAHDATDEEDDDILLGDFGSSTVFFPDEKLTLYAGTPSYMATEVKQGSYDQRIDIWSLGIVLHVLLSGAFLADDLKLNVSRIHDPQACDLLHGMLCLDPSKRFTLKQVLLHPWTVKNTSCKLPSSGNPFSVQTTNIMPAINSCKQLPPLLRRAKFDNSRTNDLVCH